jgi:DNA-binding NarL/FixJ family response regulator
MIEAAASPCDAELPMPATPRGQTAPTVPPLNPAPAEDDVITVALIEDNRLVREGITSLLNRFPDIRVVAWASSGHEPLPPDANPRVILLDLGLENGDSVRVARAVKQDFPDAGIIVMDLLPAHEEIIEFVGAGVSGFVMKDASLDEVVATIRSVAAGRDVLPSRMTGSLFSQIARELLASGEAEALDAVRLTPREREVIDLVAEGMSNKAIAQQLDISAHTVKSHLRNIMEKLTLHSRLQVAAYAIRQDADRSP